MKKTFKELHVLATLEKVSNLENRINCETYFLGTVLKQ